MSFCQGFNVVPHTPELPSRSADLDSLSSETFFRVWVVRKGRRRKRLTSRLSRLTLCKLPVCVCDMSAESQVKVLQFLLVFFVSQATDTAKGSAELSFALCKGTLFPPTANAMGVLDNPSS